MTVMQLRKRLDAILFELQDLPEGDDVDLVRAPKGGYSGDNEVLDDLYIGKVDIAEDELSSEDPPPPAATLYVV